METKNWTIYEHICPNGKRYIGITCQKPEKRWNNGRGYKHSKSFYNAIEKYKWENIQHNILFSDLTEKEAKWLENYLICYYRTFVCFKDDCKGYNMTLGGDNIISEESRKKIGDSSRGRHLSEESRRKISEANKGKKAMLGKHHSEETKRKIGEANKGKKARLGKYHTEESKKKMSQSSIGIHPSEETRKKISEATMGKKLSDETKLKMSQSKKGDKNPMYGKPLSDETKFKLSESKKGKHRVYHEDGTFHMER